MTFDESIDKLAEAIAKEASSQSVSFGERLEGLRVLTDFYKNVVAKREADDGDKGFNFNEAMSKVKQLETEEE